MSLVAHCLIIQSGSTVEEPAAGPGRGLGARDGFGPVGRASPGSNVFQQAANTVHQVIDVERKIKSTLPVCKSCEGFAVQL